MLLYYNFRSVVNFFVLFPSPFSYNAMKYTLGKEKIFLNQTTRPSDRYRSASDFSPRGLDPLAVETSRAEHGSNSLSRRPQKSFLRRFFGNLSDPVIRILLAALAVNLVLLFKTADWVETAGIAAAVFLAALISTLSERSSERAFAELSAASSNVRCRVRRGGTVSEIPISEVVVGDVVLLSAGDLIPADGLLLRGSLFSDQSSMTGESRDVAKVPSPDASMTPDAPSALFRGCTVTSGGGEMGVVSVGDATFLGEITREIQLEQRDSPLKLRLAKLAKQISILGYIAAVLVALAYLFHVFLIDSGMRREIILMKIADTPYLLSKLFHAFTLGLTVVVTAVPEGLPMMVAVVLSSNIRRMVKDQVLVRRPVGIEAAGSMNLLFTDKTGTLTEGKMRVGSVWFSSGEELTATDFLRRRTPLYTPFLLAMRGGDGTVGTDEKGRPVALGGNATDRALLSCVLGEAEPDGVRVSSRLSFDSARKYAAVSYRGTQNTTFLTGAPERLLPFVRSAFRADGVAVPFRKSVVEAQIRRWTQNGARVLAVTVSEEDVPAASHASGVRGSLSLLCLVCLSDPVRPEAAPSVRRLREAGVGVVMITGDNRETAASIASACGILNDARDLILDSAELARLSDVRLRELLPRLAVVARALPTDKGRLVRVAQETGLVTGMTGDGINDAPALRRADIGFAMGTGTQVAKDAGDIIILDNNLASIVRAVLYGRTVFKSIRKFITLQLTMNFSAVGVTMICPFLGIDSPVTVVQMLWINLIMDTLGGLAFAGEPPLPDYMKEKPKKREESILNRYMVNQITVMGAFTIAMSLLFLKNPLVTSQFRHATDNIYLFTAFFAFFIFSSVFNCFNARTDRLKLFAGLGKNPVFLAIMSAVLCIQILFVYLGGTVLRTAPLLPRELAISMLVPLSVFLADFLRKLLWRARGKRTRY